MSLTRHLRTAGGLLATALVCLVGARLSGDLSLTVNGKASDKPPIVQGGELYVPVSALKMAGAEVIQSGDRVSVVLAPAQVVSQVKGAEGNLDDWLSNGVWRIKVSSVELANGACMATIEICNISNVTTYPAITGFVDVQLYNDKGVRLKLSPASDEAWSELKSYDYAPGGSMARTLKFDATAAGTPTTMIVTVAPDADKKAFLKAKGLKYIAAPSFRIHLKAG